MCLVLNKQPLASLSVLGCEYSKGVIVPFIIYPTSFGFPFSSLGTGHPGCSPATGISPKCESIPRMTFRSQLLLQFKKAVWDKMSYAESGLGILKVSDKAQHDSVYVYSEGTLA